MSTAEGSGGSSSPEAVALGDVLAFFGTVADYASGAPQAGATVASLAVAIGRLAGLPSEELDALAFAAVLRNAGALGNAAFGKGQELNERARAMVRWDVPADGARICVRIDALPPATADIVRWQAECWDGTGYPDQLRWSGIPAAAQILNVAQRFASTPDPGDAFGAICAEAGRTFSPDATRAFVMWYHSTAAEIEPIELPVHALGSGRTTPMHVIEMLSERVDAHNATPLRAQRVGRRAEDLARTLELDAAETRRARLASLLFGIGEIRAPQIESQQFDPLARLGIDTRAANAVAAANLVADCAFAADAAPPLRARAEWYDGTGKPDRLRHDAIPRAGHILSLALAFDALDEAYRSRVTEERTQPLARLETVAGTQFDPALVRAMAAVVKAHA